MTPLFSTSPLDLGPDPTFSGASTSNGSTTPALPKTAPDVPVGMTQFGDLCGPDFSFKFNFTHPQPLVNFCNVTFVSDSQTKGANSSAGCESVTVTGLMYNTLYDVRIVAYGEDGRTSIGMFTHTTSPGNVSIEDLRALSVNLSSVQLSWRSEGTVVKNSVGYRVVLAPIQGSGRCVAYTLPAAFDSDKSQKDQDKVRPIRDEGCREKRLDSTSFNGSIVIPDLTPCTTYNVTVMSLCSCLCNKSASGTFTTVSAAPDPSELELAVHANDANSLTVQWSLESGKGVCGAVSYLLTLLDAEHNDTEEKKVVVNDFLHENASTGHNKTYTFGPLPSNHRYKVELVIKTAGGLSTLLTSEVVKTRGSVPGPVVDLHKFNTTGSSIGITWKPPQSTNGVLRKYVIRLYRNGACVNVTQVISSTERVYRSPRQEREGNESDGCNIPVTLLGNLTSQNSVVIANLLPDTEYIVNVTAVNDVGEGAGKTCRARTLVTVPNRPENFRVTQFTSNTVTLSWTPPRPRPGPTQYKVKVIDLGSPYEGSGLPQAYNERDDVPCLGGYNTTSCTVGDLHAFWRYNFNLTACTAQGTSPPATLQRSVLTEKANPGRVQGLQVHRSPDNYTAVLVTWSCPILTERNTNITGFALRTLALDDSEEDIPQAQYIQSHNCVDNFSVTVDVTPESEYIFQVKTLGDEFNGTAWTNSSVFSAPSGPSEAVSSLNVSPGANSLKVTWSAPSHTNGRLTYYIIRLTNREGCVKARVLWDVNQEPEILRIPGCDVEESPTDQQNLNDDGPHHVTFDDLSPESYYNVTVTPHNHNGAGMLRSRAVFTETGTSGPVSSLSVQSTTANSTLVHWQAPTKTNGRLKQYGIRVQNTDRSCVLWLDVLLDEEESRVRTTRSDPDADCPRDVRRDVTASADGTYSVTVSPLIPDALLLILVYPFNNAGWGPAQSQPIHTEATVPSAPRGLHKEFVNATSLRVTWQPPEPRPGQTNYTLVLNRATDIDNVLKFERDRTITLVGWNNTELTLNDLWSGWNYSITLTASTVKGSRSVQMSNVITMPESAPGNVQNFNVLPLVHEYRKCQVTWDYPAPRDRHGRIISFTITYRSRSDQTVHCNTTDCSCPNGAWEFCRSLDIVPGLEYTVKIRANNQYEGVESVRNYTARRGPPPTIRVPPAILPPTGDSQSSISVTYCASCLLDDTNGEITYFALLVCSTAYCKRVVTGRLGSEQAIKSLPTWHNAGEQDFNTLYRPTNESWRNHTLALFARSKRSAEQEGSGGSLPVYVVGADKNCASRPSSVHCNGPPPSRVMTVTCTQASCTTSAFSQPMRTLASEGGPFPTLIVVGSVLGIAAAALVVVVIIWCQRRRASKRCDRVEVEEENMPEMSLNKRPVIMQDFEDKLGEWKVKLNEDSGLPSALLEQFNVLRQLSPDHSKRVAMMDENRTKNRYCNILAFDHTRVKLAQLDDDMTSDYINANYIPGYNGKREYIATQGPLESTVDDFWRMVWEQRSPVIVMLSGLTEGRLNKVYKYYPDEDEMNEPHPYYYVTVTLTDVTRHVGYLVRTFKLSVGKSSRTVKQFYVQNWKDFDANLNANLVLEFVRAVREAVPEGNKRPLVVHCSAGVGRTGTWISIDYFMHYIRHNPLTAPIDIFNFVLTMRDCRVHMVQSAEQYVFIHDVVREIIRRKTEADRYDEPVYANQSAFSNSGYEDDANAVNSDVSSVASGERRSKGNSGSQNKASAVSGTVATNNSATPSGSATVSESPVGSLRKIRKLKFPGCRWRWKIVVGLYVTSHSFSD